MAPSLADLKLHGSGKVREIYEDGDELILVASDRISVYDVILPTQIPDKGKVLTQMSLFWFELTEDIVPNHFISEDVPPEAAGRGMRVKKLDMYPVECVVRGYLSGSGWKEYRESGAVCGIELPEGLKESDKLPEPIFTPATKAELGDHDENIDFDTAAEAIGNRPLMEELRRVSIEICSSPGAELVLGDEVLTPDSSRFWPADTYKPGGAQPSFDKQYVRDYSDSVGWDHTDPGPELPDEVVQNTRAKYVEAYEKITGRKLGYRRRRLSRARRYPVLVKAKVLIRPKEGILDPQGKAVERALPALGFDGIHDVRVGRLVELEVDDPAKLDSLSEKLLANPLIEDYEIVVDESSSANGGDPA